MAIPCQQHLLTDLPPTIFDETFRRVTERLDQYIGAATLELGGRLGLPEDRPVAAGDLIDEHGWVPEGELPLTWLLETLTLFGHAEKASGGTRFRPDRLATPADELRREFQALAPATAPAYEMLSLATAELPAILRGEKRGEDVLFGPATMNLWFEYMSNSNPHYSPNNTITATAVATHLGAGATILEVGGGGGGAAEAVLGALAEHGAIPARYVFTDVHPAFVRRGSRLVQQVASPGCEVKIQRYDINLPPVEQGHAAASFDAIIAVNTLHLARSVVTCLADLRSLLRPGGVLVFGELIRPIHSTVHLELPFTLLEAYRQVDVEEEMRPRPGFMTAEGWRTALRRAGFSDVRLLPAQLERCVEGYPGFYCGAFVAGA